MSSEAPVVSSVAAGTPSEGEVQVMALDLDPAAAVLAGLAAQLSDDERDRAARFRFERDRRRFVAARGGLRSILGTCLGEEPARIAFVYGEHGKPALAPGLGAGGLVFNVAHSDALGLVALARGGEIGIDLERVRPLSDAEAIARRFFSSRETQALMALPAPDRERAFFDCWTRKEAFIKATGEGLSRDLESFEVSLRPDEPARLEHVDGDPGEAGHWSLLSLAPAPGYAAALAVRGLVGEVSFGAWAVADDRRAHGAEADDRSRTLEAR